MGVKDEQLATRKKRSPGGGQSGRGFRTDSEFINRELTLEEVTAYREWRSDVQTVLTEWSELLEADYRFSAKWDAYGNCHAVFMFPGEDSENSGFILTGRGGSPFNALSECIFKHLQIFSGIWNRGGFQHSGSSDPDW